MEKVEILRENALLRLPKSKVVSIEEHRNS